MIILTQCIINKKRLTPSVSQTPRPAVDSTITSSYRWIAGLDKKIYIQAANSSASCVISWYVGNDLERGILRKGCGLWMVPEEGIEPSHPEGYQILSLARLPIPPLRQIETTLLDFGESYCKPLHNDFNLCDRVFCDSCPIEYYLLKRRKKFFSRESVYSVQKGTSTHSIECFPENTVTSPLNFPLILLEFSDFTK